MKKANLVSVPTLVESPFIIATIGGYTFGSATKGNYSLLGDHLNVDFPNYMKSISMVKVNGTVNSYTLTFSYQVAYGDDPNKLDKIFSKAATDRKITLSYGDWNSPAYIYKEETGIITNVSSSLNVASSSIEYTLKFTSDAIGLNATKYTFQARRAKPSAVVLEMLQNPRYKFSEIFTGMKDIQKVLSHGLISTDDKCIDIPAMKDMSPLAYLGQLVCMMTDENTSNTSSYFLSIHDDISNSLGGTYFKITKITKNIVSPSTDTYEIDVNFPTDNFVTQFSLKNDQSWAILYEYSANVPEQSFSYKIDDNGKLYTIESPSLSRGYFGSVSPKNENWWSLMTNFPIQATLTLKGLTRPSILMTYVKLNVLFHGGKKHISSGLYIITRQEDRIDSSGYKTTLSLTRVGGDE